MKKPNGLSRGTDVDNELCVSNVGSNRFNMVLIATVRAREIKRRNMNSEHREHIFPIVTALLEIQEGKIGEEYLRKV